QNKRQMKKSWWKILGLVMVAISIIAGFLGPVPALFLLHETIRNVYFHVPMWSTMFVLYLISVIYSVRYLSKGRINNRNQVKDKHRRPHRYVEIHITDV